MAIKYYDAGASGANDGSSASDAWEDLQTAFSGIAAGDTLYLKKHSSRVGDNGTTIITFNKVATSGAPTRIEGYGSTPGDGVLFETSYDLKFEGEHAVVAYIDSYITANSASSFYFNGDNQMAYRCKVYGSYQYGGTGNFVDGSAVECSFSGKLASTTNDGIVNIQRGNIINCYVESRSDGTGTNGGFGIKCSPDYRQHSLCGNLIVEKRTNPGASNGIAMTSGTQSQNNIIANNTIHKFGNAGIQIDQGVAASIVGASQIYGNLFYDLTYGIEHLQRTNANSFGWAAYNNAYGAVSSGQTTGLTENFDPITLTGDPFVDHIDYQLNTTSGAGALLRGLRGLPDSKDPTSSTRKSFPSVGAIQPELGSAAVTVGFAI